MGNCLITSKSKKLTIQTATLWDTPQQVTGSNTSITLKSNWTNYDLLQVNANATVLMPCVAGQWNFKSFWNISSGSTSTNWLKLKLDTSQPTKLILVQSDYQVYSWIMGIKFVLK